MKPTREPTPQPKDDPPPREPARGWPGTTREELAQRHPHPDMHGHKEKNGYAPDGD